MRLFNSAVEIHTPTPAAKADANAAPHMPATSRVNMCAATPRLMAEIEMMIGLRYFMGYLNQLGKDQNKSTQRNLHRRKLLGRTRCRGSQNHQA